MYFLNNAFCPYDYGNFLITVYFKSNFQVIENHIYKTLLNVIPN